MPSSSAGRRLRATCGLPSLPSGQNYPKDFPTDVPLAASFTDTGGERVRIRGKIWQSTTGIPQFPLVGPMGPVEPLTQGTLRRNGR